MKSVCVCCSSRCIDENDSQSSLVFPHWADKLPDRVGLDTWEASPRGDFTSEEYKPVIYWFPMFSFLRSAVSSGWEKKNKDPPHQMLLEKPLSLRVLQMVLFCHNSLYISSTHRQTVIYLKHNFINIFEGCKVKSACNSQPILCLLCAVFQSETTLLNHFSKLQLLEYIYKQIHFTFISVCAVSL